MPAVVGETVVPFHEIAPNASVRYAIIEGVGYLSVRDIIMAVCCNEEEDAKKDKRKKQAKASQTWHTLPETCKNEVSLFLRNLQFKGPGQSEQPVIQFQGALKLLMWLPGTHAKILRSKASEILTRYFAGDSSLHAEVEANAESGAAINEAARAALPQVVVESNKRRKTVATLEKELAVLTVVTSNLKEQNLSLREQIELKRELYGVELGYERDKLGVAGQGRAQELEHERAKLSLMDESRKSEVEHKKALKAIENGPVVEASLPPSAYTTVLKVYTKHQHEFSCVPSKAKMGLLRVAGKKAADTYRGVNGLHPSTIPENDLEVKQYPVEYEDMIMSSLRAACKDILAGGSQQPIDGMFIKARKEGQDTIVNLNFTSRGCD